MSWLWQHRLGVWAFAVAIAFVPGFMSAAYVGRWSLIAVGTPILAPIAFDRFAPCIQIMLIAGLAWAASSIAIAPNQLTAALELFFMLCVTGVAIVGSYAESLDDALAGLALGLGMSSGFGIVAWLWHPLVEQGSAGFAGLFYSSEVFAEFAAPVFVWALIARRWPLALCALFPVIANGSRIALVTSVIGIAYACRPRARAWLVAYILVLGAVALALAYYLIESRFGSAALRMVIWGETALAISPLGSGLGWFQITHVDDYAHSDLLQAYAELGLGAIFFTVIPIYVFTRGGGSNAERAAFLVVCLESIVSFPLHTPAAAFVAALLAGHLAHNRARLCGERPHGRMDDVARCEGATRARWPDNGGHRRFGFSVRSPASQHAALALA